MWGHPCPIYNKQKIIISESADLKKDGQPKRIDSIVFLVNDLRKSTDFYKNILKLSLKLKSPTWAEFVVDGVHIGLHQRTMEQSVQIEEQECYSVSIQFEVENLDDHVEFLQLHGVELVGGIRESKFGRYAFFTDPDGHILGLREYRRTPAESL